MHENPEIHYNPFLYEINTRVWIKRFYQDEKITIDQVPLNYWREFKQNGFDYIWLMGVWQTNQNTIEKYCFEEGLVNEYKSALHDFKHEDVIGSPFSIEDYKVNPELGGEESLKLLKQKLNALGLKLIIDFIPNHFSAESELVKTNPELFLQGTEEQLNADPDTFFQVGDKIFAHGKDPFFPAWKDTIQVNYFSEEARQKMIDYLMHVSQYCDGVRCDMAMLVDNPVFRKTWSETKRRKDYSIPETEFWEDAINKLKSQRNDFTFIAEVYWDREYELQQLGFDFTYDKTFTERLIAGDVDEIKAHLWADDGFQRQSVRFLENHDEPRITDRVNEEKAKAAAVALTTVQGMKLIHDGQCEGKRIKLPAQLGREPHEAPNKELRSFYEKLYSITSRNIFKRGRWEPIDPDEAWDDNTTNENMLVWLWSYDDERILVIINYSDEPSQCNLKIDTKDFLEDFPLKDLLNDVEYMRSAREIHNIGLYVELQPYQSHIFYY